VPLQIQLFADQVDQPDTQPRRQDRGQA
jgi:hypothetical protein